MHLEDVYARDTGQTMGKEEPANLCFKREKARLKVRMVCCFELQWGYRGHGFGIETASSLQKCAALSFPVEIIVRLA